MTPKQRTTYADLKLPDNVKVSARKNKAGEEVLYFYYLTPSGIAEPLGKDVEIAKAAAAALNLKLYQPSDRIKQLIANSEVTHQRKNPFMSDLCDEFKEQWLIPNTKSENYLKNQVIKLNQYKREWERKPIREFATYDLARFVSSATKEAARQHRLLLITLFDYAKGQGYYLAENPANSLLKISQQTRKRKRHTWEGHLTVRDKSPTWLANAINNAFYTLQRRSDLVRLTRTKHISIPNGTITVLQEKTRNYDEPVFIEIAMGNELRASVVRSYASGLVCPYLVHYKPQTLSKKTREAKPHQYAVLPDYLSKQYTKYRDLSGAYDHLPKNERPTFHDIRALGIFAYYKAGYETEYIMALAGHADKKMTAHYLQGHERPKPMRVEAGLSLSNVDFGEIDWQTDLPKELRVLIDDEQEPDAD